MKKGMEASKGRPSHRPVRLDTRNQSGMPKHVCDFNTVRDGIHSLRETVYARKANAPRKRMCECTFITVSP